MLFAYFLYNSSVFEKKLKLTFINLIQNGTHIHVFLVKYVFVRFSGERERDREFWKWYTERERERGVLKLIYIRTQFDWWYIMRQINVVNKFHVYTQLNISVCIMQLFWNIHLIFNLNWVYMQVSSYRLTSSKILITNQRSLLWSFRVLRKGNIWLFY